MVTLITPHRGYTRGQLTGKVDGYRYEIKLSSGEYIWRYDDEFEKD